MSIASATTKSSIVMLSSSVGMTGNLEQNQSTQFQQASTRSSGDLQPQTLETPQKAPISPNTQSHGSKNSGSNNSLLLVNYNPMTSKTQSLKFPSNQTLHIQTNSKQKTDHQTVSNDELAGTLNENFTYAVDQFEYSNENHHDLPVSPYFPNDKSPCSS